MVYKISDNIISPLGNNTEDNYVAVKEGKTALQLHEGKWNIPEPFYASLFSDEQINEYVVKGFTFFESLIIRSVTSALSGLDIPYKSQRVIFIVSTTKANVAELEDENRYASLFLPGQSVKRVAEYLELANDPIVVCNACISGVSAIITAKRLLEAGFYDYAIVCGADCQCKFIVSGFQSLKAVSSEACRPFDLERLGLNLGEAVATMILATNIPDGNQPVWSVTAGAVHNDAHHISSPSPKGEGSCQCLKDVIKENDTTDLAFINLHGTATMYNDQMESKAVERAELLDIDVNGYKGYYGHTMGAAGILETIISMKAVENNTVIATKGFENRGVSGKINIARTNLPTNKRSFIKLISGFGGCNAALHATLNKIPARIEHPVSLRSIHEVKINSSEIILDGKRLAVEGCGKTLITNAYKLLIGGYPKFYKMDLLSRLGFLASELLLQAENDERFSTHHDRGVILFNKVSSLIADKEYEESIKDAANYFPSPSAFVYTLPNIVTGEIALRNGYHGETSFYILPEYNEEYMQKIISSAFQDSDTKSCIGGWIDCENEQKINVMLNLFVNIN